MQNNSELRLAPSRPRGLSSRRNLSSKRLIAAAVAGIAVAAGGVLGGACFLDGGPYEGTGGEQGGNGGNGGETLTTGTGGTGGNGGEMLTAGMGGTGGNGGETLTTGTGGSGGNIVTTTTTGETTTITETGTEMMDGGTNDYAIDNLQQKGKVVVVRAGQVVGALSTPDGQWINDGTINLNGIEANDVIIYTCLPPCDLKVTTSLGFTSTQAIEVYSPNANFNQNPPTQNEVVQIYLGQSWTSVDDQNLDPDNYLLSYQVQQQDAGVGQVYQGYSGVRP